MGGYHTNDPASHLNRLDIERKIRERSRGKEAIDTTTYDYAVKMALITGDFSDDEKTQIRANLNLEGGDSPVPPVPGASAVLRGTTAYWNNYPQLVAGNGTIYEYTDYMRKGDGNLISGFKIGDGKSYLRTLPFINADIQNHMANTSIHTSSDEKDNWDKKISCRLEGSETLTFFKDE